MKRVRHGESDTPEYRAWFEMRSRCTNPNRVNYRYYGGRGIRVCDAWMESFLAFRHDVGKRPSPAFTLDRIDTNGNYEPGNVRWATRSEQQRSRRKLMCSKPLVTHKPGFCTVCGESLPTPRHPAKKFHDHCLDDQRERQREAQRAYQRSRYVAVNK